jgi:hypothetical protein
MQNEVHLGCPTTVRSAATARATSAAAAGVNTASGALEWLQRQPLEAVQTKMVKALRSYTAARDAWSLLILPAACPQLPRLGFVKNVYGTAADSAATVHGGISAAAKVPFVQMLNPVGKGTEVYLDTTSNSASNMVSAQASYYTIYSTVLLSALHVFMAFFCELSE